MNANRIFSSCLSRFMDMYVEDFQARCLKTNKIVYVLSSLDRYLVNVGCDNDYITRDLFLGWADTMVNLSRATAYTNKLMVAGFCRYLTMIGHPSYQPPRMEYARCEFIPHIYSEEELCALFSAADNWRGRSFPRTSLCFIMPALLRVLYSTGMRIGEALQIRIRDIDLKKQLIFLRFTKNGRDRISPINDSLSKVIKQYLSYRDKMPFEQIKDPDSTLFVNLKGEPCGVKNVERQFKKMIAESGSFTGYVRIHDIRHTSCVHAMRRLILEGHDIYNVLPKLSAFMGHIDVSSTEHYVRLTNEVYPEIFEAELPIKQEINNLISRAAFYEEEYD